MWLAPWDSALTSKMSGSVGNGASLSLINQSLIKSYFLLWLLRTCGDFLSIHLGVGWGCFVH